MEPYGALRAVLNRKAPPTASTSSPAMRDATVNRASVAISARAPTDGVDTGGPSTIGVSARARATSARNRSRTRLSTEPSTGSAGVRVGPEPIRDLRGRHLAGKGDPQTAKPAPDASRGRVHRRARHAGTAQTDARRESLSRRRGGGSQFHAGAAVRISHEGGLGGLDAPGERQLNAPELHVPAAHGAIEQLGPVQPGERGGLHTEQRAHVRRLESERRLHEERGRPGAAGLFGDRAERHRRTQHALGADRGRRQQRPRAERGANERTTAAGHGRSGDMGGTMEGRCPFTRGATPGTPVRRERMAAPAGAPARMSDSTRSRRMDRSASPAPDVTAR